VVDFDRSEEGRSWVEVEGDLPEGAVLAGSMLRVRNDGVRDACYSIAGAERRASDRLRIDLGDTSLIRGLACSTDYAKGYTYNIAPDQDVEVLNAVDIRIRDGDSFAVEANTGWVWQDSSASR
jgi:hypothetical protein